MFICKDCGRLLDDGDLILRKEYDEDCRHYETDVVCPCGGDCLEEAVQCEECGEWFPAYELYDGICEECLKQEMTVDNAIECGKEGGARQTVSVNGFLAACFSEEDIEKILIEKLESVIAGSDAAAMAVMVKARDWCDEDVSYFADWLKANRRK